MIVGVPRYASAYCNGSLPFKRQPRKMVKYGQTNCLGVFDHFVGLVLKGLIKWKKDSR